MVKKLTTEQMARKCFCELVCPYDWKRMKVICDGITELPCNVDFKRLVRIAHRFLKMEQKQKEK